MFKFFKKQPPILAYSFRGGGLKCASYFGVLNIFQQNNIFPNMVIGASGGALVSAGLSSGKTYDELINATRELNSMNILGINSILKQTIADKDKIYSILKNIFGDLKIENLNIKTYIQVTNIETFKPEIIESGNLLDAVMASISLPLLLPPYNIDGKDYMDGDLSQAFCNQFLKDKGATHTIGFSVCEINSYKGKLPQNIIEKLSLFGCTVLNLQKQDLILDPVDLLIENTAGRITHILDFDGVQGFYDYGKSQGNKYLPKIQMLLKEKTQVELLDEKIRKLKNKFNF